MNKPILFIDEKPFHSNPKIRKESYKIFLDLKERLQRLGGIDLVEFFFEKNPDRRIPKDYESPEFAELMQGRRYVVIHNSYPDSKDPNPIMPDSEIKVFRTKLPEGTQLIRFSGAIRRRLEELQKDEPKIKHLAYNREDLYRNFDIFVRHLQSTNFQHPFHLLLENGKSAFYFAALELRDEIESNFYFNSIDVPTFVQKVQNQKTERRLKANWKQQIGNSIFLRLCNLTGWDNTKIERAAEKIKQRATSYDSPEGYLTDLDKIIKEVENRSV